MRKHSAYICAVVLSFVLCQISFAQQATKSQTAKGASAPTATGTQQENIQEYIQLLRGDVRHQKSQIMGAVMQLDPDQAAKFWPIYSEYDAALTKLNDQRVANIQEYARVYDQMTDARADELIQKAFTYRKQRSELLATYYGRVKDSLGAIEAARFLQVEDQLLALIDLQIASQLPIVEHGQ